MEHVLSQFFHMVGTIMFCSAITFLLIGIDLSTSMQQDLMPLNQKEVIEEKGRVEIGEEEAIVTYAELLIMLEKTLTYKICVDSIVVEKEDDTGLQTLFQALLAEDPKLEYKKSYTYDSFGVIQYISYDRRK